MSGPKTIAIDFDDTITADPLMWRSVIGRMRDRGHKVICVTGRRFNAENKQAIDEYLAECDIELTVFYTNLGSKIRYMESTGLKVDIWIDDNPQALVHGS